MREDLGVGLGDELMPLLDEALLQLGVVLDDAVVNDGDRPRAIGMRVGVVGVGLAVGGPARMSDAHTAGGTVVGEDAFERGDLARGLLGCDLAVLLHGNPRRIVPAVLEPFEAGNQDVNAILGSDVTHDATHEGTSSSVAPRGGGKKARGARRLGRKPFSR